MRKSLKPASRPPTWCAVGIDASFSSIAIAAILFDSLNGLTRGPSWKTVRWNQGEHYLDRLAQAARAPDLIHDVLGPLIAPVALEETYIGIEEPFPAHSGFTKRAPGNYLMQQAEISGAIRGSLVRYGYQNIYQVANKTWKTVVAREMGMKQNSAFTKWTVKEWALLAYDKLPDLPDLIQGPKGKIPKPATSRAKPVQPDDLYDAVGIASYVMELVETQTGR